MATPSYASPCMDFPHFHFRWMAFSLIEMLLVMVIMGMLAALAIPSSMAMMSGMRLTTAGRTIVDKLTMARQRAIARNHTVEVRFYQYGDAAAGEDVSAASAGKYRAFQFWEFDDSGKYVALGKLERLPSSVIIDSNALLTSLFNVSAGVRTGGTNGSLPEVGTAYNFIAFQFRPDGSTNLTPNSLWFLSLHDIRNGDSLAVLPANYYTIQIDSSNGHIKSYRP
jgi:uncharacterized protein (TIGR02596 family)